MAEQLTTQQYRELMRKYGRDAFIKEEMIALGFWPPNLQALENREKALADLKIRRGELIALHQQLSGVEKEIGDVTNLEALIDEIRKKRIERVRLQREERKAARLLELEAKHTAEAARRREEPPFLGRGVSTGLKYDGGSSERLAASNLPKLTTAGDIARAIGIEEHKVAWLTYHRGAATIDHYYRFTIPKRSGGTRVISSPKKQLRVAQNWVLNSILSKIELHPAAAAFRAGRSIVDNARLHQERAIVVRLDLKDFFPSIKLRRVKGLFQSFGYNEGVATIMALLCTEAPRVEIKLDGETRYVSLGERQLPQGACTSPLLTNILCRRLDTRLTALSQKFGFTYSRYADDLVFSHSDSEAKLGLFLTLVKKVIQTEGFILNEDKTRIMRQQHRQTVTGLVVNQQPHLSRDDLRKFRAFLHHCEKEGFAAVSEKTGRNARAYASGYLAFIQMVSPERAKQIFAANPWLEESVSD